MGTLNENEEYREQTDKLFMPHSACGFHALSLSTDAKASEGVPSPEAAAGVSRHERTIVSEGARPEIIAPLRSTAIAARVRSATWS